MADSPSAAVLMLPRDLKPGDQVWLSDGTHWRWMTVAGVDKRPPRRNVPVRYAVWFAGDGHQGFAELSSRERQRVRRPARNWPVWYGTPPCEECGEPARLVNKVGTRLHRAGCQVPAREAAELAAQAFADAAEELG